MGDRRLGRQGLKAAFVRLQEPSGAAPRAHRAALLIALAHTAHVSCRWPGYQTAGAAGEKPRRSNKETFLGFRGICFPTSDRENQKNPSRQNFS